jgi:hypothetical protein
VNNVSFFISNSYSSLHIHLIFHLKYYILNLTRRCEKSNLLPILPLNCDSFYFNQNFITSTLHQFPAKKRRDVVRLEEQYIPRGVQST